MNDRKTTIQQLKGKIKKFQQKRDWNNGSRDIAISIIIEAAELLEYFQWDDFVKNKAKNKKEIECELADVIIYCLEFALSERIDISKAIGEKMKINAKNIR